MNSSPAIRISRNAILAFNSTLLLDRKRSIITRIADRFDWLIIKLVRIMPEQIGKNAIKASRMMRSGESPKIIAFFVSLGILNNISIVMIPSVIVKRQNRIKSVVLRIKLFVEFRIMNNLKYLFRMLVMPQNRFVRMVLYPIHKY